MNKSKNMKVRLYFKSFCKKAINEAVKIVLDNASDFNLNVGLFSVSLPTRIKKFCVLRSPHVNKDSREEFEIRIYKKFLDITVQDLSQISELINSFAFPSGIGCYFSILSK